jgi:hypothetical protein
MIQAEVHPLVAVPPLLRVQPCLNCRAKKSALGQIMSPYDQSVNVIVGTGPAGIAMAYRLKHDLGFKDFTIYEKLDGVGETGEPTHTKDGGLYSPAVGSMRRSFVKVWAIQPVAFQERQFARQDQMKLGGGRN